ncbi:MAG: RimK family alpha-L-glutamate ligase [Clostridiales bacterium]|nr:RimK family alpha-L-glutamate ligase [Clostridiales bacterium]
MKGLLIINEYLNAKKYSEHTEWLMQAAQEAGICMDLMTNAECLVELGFHGEDRILNKQYDFVLFWDKDINLALHLEMCGLRVFNCAKAIANCDDKSKTHLILQHNGVRMPKTILAPMTYPNIGYTNDEFLTEIIETLHFPLVVKECFGSFGAQVYLAHEEEELKQILRTIGAKPMLFQEFIEYSAGKDVRLQVVGDEVVASMYRYSVNGDFRANISNGGHMRCYEPSEEEKALAISCCRLLELSFAGVDLLFGEDGEPIVCEVNSNAHFRNIYECTKVNTATKIIEFIIKTIS